MQYGIELFPYERSGKTNKSKRQSEKNKINMIIKGFVYLIAGFLLSRASLTEISMPFGIAILIAYINIKENRFFYVLSLGSFLGYLTLVNKFDEISLYYIYIATFVIMKYFFSNILNKRVKFSGFVVFLLESFIYKIFVASYIVQSAIIAAAFELLCVIPIVLIINYSRNCFLGIKTKHLFTSEELVVMGIFISIAISGTFGVEFYEIYLKNILALLFLICISYTNGVGIGAAVGICMGLIFGISTGNISDYVAFLGLCAVVPGIFKDTGKNLSGICFVIVASILVFYKVAGSDFRLVEVLISTGIFLIIPDKYYKEITLEFSNIKKEEKMQEACVHKIKTIFVDRLNEFSDVLFNMSRILYNLVDNDKLVLKSKSSLVVENLADRVCSSCDMNNICWKREMHYTYSAFSELIENFHDSSRVMPKELERKCVKRSALLKNTEEIINNYMIDEMCRLRLSEGRELIASQVENIGLSVAEIMGELHCDIQFNWYMENRIKNILKKNRIDIEDCICIEDKNHRLNVKLSLEWRMDIDSFSEKILSYINQVTPSKMCINEDGIKVDGAEKKCYLTYTLLPKYYVSTFVARCCKEGESLNGDSYFFTKLKDGSFLSIISDGMGSGPMAGKESKAVIDLIEKLTLSGFSKIAAINTTNSVMTLKFSEDEKYSTVDLSSLDLYTGDIEFYKLGAVASFIKRGNDIISIKSKTLPMGVLDKVDVDVNRLKVNSGDIIIMLSDGVIGESEWIEDFLEEYSSYNPKALADAIIEKSIEINGKALDDMTVLVSKVICVY